MRPIVLDICLLAIAGAAGIALAIVWTSRRRHL